MPEPYCNPDKYTAECIAGVAFNAGIRDTPTLERATAIALAESSGRTKVVNGIGCCVGLWQINVKAHTQYTTAQMQNPQENAKAMLAISNNGANWSPWETFTTGAYILFIPAAKAGVAKLKSKSGGTIDNNPLVPDVIEGPYDSAQATAQAIGDIATFPAKILAWISDRNNIIRLAKAGVGVAIIIVGIGVVARPVFKPVASAATKAAKVAL